MLFLLRPGRGSFLGQVLASIRSALLVGVALAAVPYLDARVHKSGRAPNAAAWRAITLPGENGQAPVRPVSREEGAALNGTRLSGRVTHVRDGDTVEVRGVPVRIANLDCAERDTAAGRVATRRMERLARVGPLTCRLTGGRSFDREVGTCVMPDGRDIGAVLISEGTCDIWR